MKIGFVEDPEFTSVIEDYFGGDEHYRRLQETLSENPEAGTVIPGATPLRKLRWPDPRWGQGKRGGLRIIYIYLPGIRMIAFLDVYSKEEAEDLSPETKRELKRLAERIKANLLEREKEFQ